MSFEVQAPGEIGFEPITQGKREKALENCRGLRDVIYRMRLYDLKGLLFMAAAHPFPFEHSRRRILRMRRGTERGSNCFQDRARRGAYSSWVGVF